MCQRVSSGPAPGGRSRGGDALSLGCARCGGDGVRLLIARGLWAGDAPEEWEGGRDELGIVGADVADGGWRSEDREGGFDGRAGSFDRTAGPVGADVEFGHGQSREARNGRRRGGPYLGGGRGGVGRDAAEVPGPVDR